MCRVHKLHSESRGRQRSMLGRASGLTRGIILKTLATSSGDCRGILSGICPWNVPRTTNSCPFRGLSNVLIHILLTRTPIKNCKDSYIIEGDPPPPSPVISSKFGGGGASLNSSLCPPSIQNFPGLATVYSCILI